MTCNDSFHVNSPVETAILGVLIALVVCFRPSASEIENSSPSSIVVHSAFLIQSAEAKLCVAPESINVLASQFPHLTVTINRSWRRWPLSSLHNSLSRDSYLRQWSCSTAHWRLSFGSCAGGAFFFAFTWLKTGERGVGPLTSRQLTARWPDSRHRKHRPSRIKRCLSSAESRVSLLFNWRSLPLTAFEEGTGVSTCKSS